MTLSELMIKYRKEHGMSQRQFAIRCGVSNGYISMLERNINPSTGEAAVPSLPMLRKIAAGMGISLDNLFAKVDDMPVMLNRAPEPRIDMASYLDTLTDAELLDLLQMLTAKLAERRNEK
jgi:transcriptional regulator with XRE-family HTH domain